jgi:hypothetical protein
MAGDKPVVELPMPVLAATLLWIAAGCSSVQAAPRGADPATPMRIAEAAKMKPAGQIRWVVGYVVHLYRCPPCPEGAACEDCLDDHLVLSDKPERAKGYPHAEGRKDWLFVVPPPQDLGVGKAYRLLIEWRKGSAHGWPPTVGYTVAVR